MKCESFIINNINLHFIETNKFETVTVLYKFTQLINKKDMLKRKLLFSYLKQSSNKYKTERLVNIEKEKLSILNMISNETYRGIYSVNCLGYTCLKNKYTNKNNEIECLDFLNEMMFNPNFINDDLDQKEYKKIYTKTKTNILKIEDNVDYKSQKETLLRTDENNPILWDINQLQQIDKLKTKDIVKTYKKILSEDRLDIFILGQVNKEKYIDSIKKLKWNNNFKIDSYNYEYNDYNKTIVKENIYDEKVKQSILTIVYKLINLNENERKIVLPIFNFIYGGGTDSKLFKIIREKYSYAYYIYSQPISDLSLLIIKGGIDKLNGDDTEKLVIELFDSMKKITKKELEIAKKYIISKTKNIFNNRLVILNYFYSINVFNIYSIEQSIEEIKKVTVEDIINLIEKIKLQTIVLYGDVNEKK